jgi:tRNA(Met) C34 N-acetyltransferase TmcA
MMYRALSRYRNDDPQQDWLAKVLLIDAEAGEEIA